MAETFHINVMGQKFLLKGTFEREYIERVEKYINQKIEEVKKEGGTPDSYNLMILVALNLVDDCLKKDMEIKNMIETFENKTSNLIKFIDSKL